MSIEIINRALIKIGEPPIVSINQHPYGESLGLIYEDARKALLSTHFWRFALKRTTLAKIDEDTESEVFAFSYALPSDFVQIKSFGEMYKMPNFADKIIQTDARYSIEGNRILTREDGPIRICYVADEKDTIKFTPNFREALIAVIAAEISVRIKNGADYKTLFMQEADRYVMQAISHNEIARDMETMPDNSWVACRETWLGDF